MNKKFICLGVILWYVVFVSFLTPQLLSYFFEKDTLNAELFAELISFGLPVSIALLSHNKAGEPLFPFVNIRLYQERKRIITAAAVGLFYAVCMLFLNSAYELIYVFVTGSSDIVQRHTEVPPWAILYMVLIYALLPSIFEELFYRGMFDQLFSQKAKVSPIIISAFLFALTSFSKNSPILYR